MSDFKIVKLLDPVVSLTTNVKPRGAYSSGTTYGIGDAVSFGNSSYIAIQPTTGNAPTDTAYWQLLASSSTNKLSTIARNSTGATIPKGTVVYFSGASGNLPTLALSQANSEASSTKTVGITAVSIANNSDGEVIVFGLADGQDTSSFAAGSALWLSPTVPGGMTTTKPVAPNHMVFIGFVTRSHPTDGTIEIKIQNGFELEELHNVLITSVSNNQVLAYESSSSLWKNKTLTKSDVGLSNVDNTSDLNKPISTATQTALNAKQDSLGFTPENASNKSTDGTLASNSDTLYPSQKAVKTYVDNSVISATIPDATSSVKGKLKLAGDLSGTADSPTVPGLSTKEPLITAGTTSQYFRGDKTFQTLDKSAVGLGNVDNTSDINKPISTAVQTALDGKFNNPTGTNIQYIAGDGSILNFPAVPTGTQIVATVINGSASTIDAFRPVYIMGSSGGIPTIALGSASGFVSNRIIGFTTASVAAGATTSIVIFGLVENVDTSAFAAGDTLYLSMTGTRLTATKPSTNVVVLGTIGKSDAITGTFLLNLIRPLQLSDMAGVFISSPVSGHSLVYDAASIRWTNRFLTKSEVGLANVDNTSDMNKPVSTAQLATINAKVADAINDGVTMVAPSQNAVYDALQGKQDYFGSYTPEDVANKATTLSTINDTLYPSVKLVNDSFVKKTGDEMTGTLDNRSNDPSITLNYRARNGNHAGGACSSYENKDNGVLKIGMTGLSFTPVDLINANAGFIKSSQEMSIDVKSELKIGIEGVEVAKFNNDKFTANKIDASPVAIIELDSNGPKDYDNVMFYGVDDSKNYKTTFSELPISTAVQDALNLKEDAVALGTVSQYYRGDKTFQDLVLSAIGQSGATSGQVPTWNGSTWAPQTPTGGGGGAINLDGGFPDSTYGAVSPIDGGSP